jgi:thymidylate synthase (FAD)
MMDITEKWVPASHEAFLEYRMGAVNLSRTAIAVVRRMIAGEKVIQASSGLTQREWNEMISHLELADSSG